MNIANPHFAEPSWLWLALFGPLALLGLQRYAAWRRQHQIGQLAGPSLLPELLASHSPWRRAIKNALLVLAVAGVGLTLARPQWGEEVESSHWLGQDTLFVLDCSRSMLANDVSPSRLQRARFAIADFVQRQGHGRVGLVAFAEQAFLQCPLTFDYGAFQDALSAVDEKTIPVPGTDVGRALDEAFHAAAKGDQQKVFILLTDGEDLEKGGVRMAESLARKGVVVFTIGVGTPSGAEIQVLNEQGKPELVRDSGGEVVRSRLDETTLREIAKVTHGAYYPLGPVGEGLAKVRLAMQDLSDAGGLSPARKLGVDRFHWPLSGVLLLLVLESLIGTRRRQCATARAPQAPALALT